MALLFCDGFDHIEDGYELIKWDAYFNASVFTYGTDYGCTGGNGAYLFNNYLYYADKSLNTNAATVIFGMRMKVIDYLGSQDTVLDFMAGGSANCVIKQTESGAFAVYRSSTLLGSTSSYVIKASTWTYFEIKVVFSQTVGTVTIKIDGVQVLNLTGLDNCNTSYEYCDTVRLSGFKNKCYVDDLYICDASGSYNNDFLGEVTITTMYPVADGTYTDFTPSTGTDHFAVVDDPQLSDDTDHNESSTVSHKDSYDMTTMSGADTIHGLQICSAVKNTDTGAMSIRNFVRSGGTPADTEGSDFALSQTMKGAMTIYEQEPVDVVAWTQAKVNSAEFGIKVQS